MKKNKSFIIPLISLATAFAVATPTLVSCVTTQKQDVEEPDSVEYTTVTFCAPEGVTIKGTAVVKAKVGRQFATVMQPIAIKENAKFAYWTLDLEPDIPTKIEWNTPITKDMKVYPVFEDQIILANCVGISAIETTTIKIVNHGDSNPDIHYTQNYGKDDWPEFPAEGLELFPGQNIFIKGDNQSGFSTSDSDYTTISFTGAEDPAPAINISGDVMGLINDGTGKDEEGLPSDYIPNDYCFYHLLEGNPAIKYVSDTFLPAITLTEHCYDGLFSGCTSIITAPYLPATALLPENDSNASQAFCYNELFAGCSSLNMVRLAYTGGDCNCFTNWLDDVASTGEIVYDQSQEATSPIPIPSNWSVKVTTTDISIACTDLMYAQDPTDYVFSLNHPYQLVATPSHVDPEKNDEPTPSQHINWYSSDTRVATVNPESGVVTGIRPGNVDICAQATDGTGVKAFFPMEFKDITLSNTMYVEAVTATSVSWDFVGAGSLPQFSYSTDTGASWHTMQASVAVDLAQGSKIYIKGDNIHGFTPKSSPSSSYAHFAFDDSSQVNIGGDIMGLLDDCRGELTGLTELSEDSNYAYCFNNLFTGEVAIRDVSPTFLPMTDLSAGCYAGMFADCTNLATAPNLPSKVLKNFCYSSMFFNCSSLVNPPIFPEPSAEESIILANYCCRAMFYDCHSLTSSPELYATSATVGCYYMMFQYCWNLTTVGKIHLEDFAVECCFQMYALSDSQRGHTSKITFNNWYYSYEVWNVPNKTIPTDAVTKMFNLDTPGKNETWGYR